jgi:hypothetical protein
MLSEGAGAEMRRTLGTAVFSGMLGVTLFGIFLTPVFYYVIQYFTDRRALAYDLIESATRVWDAGAVSHLDSKDGRERQTVADGAPAAHVTSPETNHDPVSEIEAALKALRGTPDLAERQNALDALDKATRRLRQGCKPSSKK